MNLNKDIRKDTIIFGILLILIFNAAPFLNKFSYGVYKTRISPKSPYGENFFFSQRDPAWKNDLIIDENEVVQDTIETIGLAMTSELSSASNPLYMSVIHIDGSWIEAEILGICSGSGTYNDPYVIKDLIIDATNYNIGILIENSNEYFRIENCTILNARSMGIRLNYVAQGTLVNNTCQYTWMTLSPGIYITYSNNITVIGNDCSYNHDGIRLDYSENCNITSNTARDNHHFGITIFHSNNNRIMENDCSEDNKYRFQDYGIFLGHSDLNLVYNNNCSGLRHGIVIAESDNNTIIGNLCQENYIGLTIRENSNNNTISSNNCGNNGYGIFMGKNKMNKITKNNCSLNSNTGIYLIQSNNSILSNNIISNNINGFIISESRFNTIKANNFRNNQYLFIGDDSKYNKIYLNNFVNNDNYNFETSLEFWNSPEEITYTFQDIIYTDYLGNFWDSYTGSDLDGNGIGDSPHIIDSYNQDQYPLILPFENYFIPTLDQPPNCIIELQKGGVEINEIDVGEFFDIYVGDSYDDYGITQVRFMSDDSQDGMPLGTWTDWYEWNTASGDWDDKTKIKRWAFATGGSKEVWAEVKDTEDQTDSDHSWITATSINLPPIASIICSTQQAKSGEYIAFDASNSYDPEGGQLQYDWDFGDGETASGCLVNHRFRGAQNKPQTYTVSLTVEDNFGLTDTKQIEIKILILIRTIEIVTTIPFQEVNARMTVYYNWVEDNTYIVTKISYQAIYFLGVATLSIWDFHSRPIPTPIWADNNIIDQEAAYYPVKDIYQHGWEIFEGILVDGFDAMNMYTIGWYRISMGTSPPFPSFKTVSACFKPDYYEEPEVPVEAPNSYLGKLFSPGELRIFDSEGRATGLFNGVIINEIPNSFYIDNTVIILSSDHSGYYSEIEGTENGEYGFVLNSIIGEESNIFVATDIPLSLNEIHQYIIDWDLLSHGGEGVEVEVDSDGDGIIEHSFTSDNELNTAEYVVETITWPYEGDALQDGVVFELETFDNTLLNWITVSIREPGGEDGIFISEEFENIPLIYDNEHELWGSINFDTTQLPDCYYILFVQVCDASEFTSTITFDFSIRNWALLILLPATETNRAGRTMPVKFSLRVVEAVDPEMPFVCNEELEIIIYDKINPDIILQYSNLGDTSVDYRISSEDELYITNFKTSKTPAVYRVEIWRKGMLIGSFEFETYNSKINEGNSVSSSFENFQIPIGLNLNFLLLGMAYLLIISRKKLIHH